ncbi:MAG: ribokinase [Spirochaetota bacterium]
MGSINMDVIIKVDRLPKPGESVICDRIEKVPGGKGANQAVAASRLGCPVAFIGKLGNDEHGRQLLKNLKKNKVDVSYIDTVGEQTGTAYIILEPDGQNRILVNAGANLAFGRKDMELMENVIDGYEMILLQLEIPLDTVGSIITLAVSKGKKVIVDAGPARSCDPGMFKGVYILSPNETEAEKLTGLEINNFDKALKAADIFLQKGVKKVVLKMGSKGALYVDAGDYKHIPAYKTEVVDTTAAGDAFTAAMAVKLLEGSDMISAVEYGNKAGSMAVSRLGAQPSLPYRQEIESATFLQ